jgi:hypothetical protein
VGGLFVAIFIFLKKKYKGFPLLSLTQDHMKYNFSKKSIPELEIPNYL